MNNQCPSCQRLLYDRRLPYCGYCGAAIPKSLQFSEEQIAAIDRDMAELDEQSRQRLLAAEKKVEDWYDAHSGGYYVGDLDGLPSRMPFMGNGLE